MYKPNYEKDNIVNLMSSIKNAYGKKHLYNNLELIPPSYIKKYNNVILLVIDGLGYNYLSNKKDSFLYKHLKGKLTGAFPLTTAASNSVFNYGVPVQQHGLTGWYVYLKEIGAISTALPFTERYHGSHLEETGLNVKDIVLTSSFTDDIDVESYILLDSLYSHSAVSKHAAGPSKIIGTKPMLNTFSSMRDIIYSNNNYKYIHAYIGNFDSYGHKYGIDSVETYELFIELDNQIKSFIKDIKETNTTLIITADHGMKDTREDKVINLNDYPEIMDCLVMPLSGDSRVRYLYVRPKMVSRFEQLVLDKLSDYGTLYNSQELLKDNWFGLFTEHKNIKYRIGDYAMIMKDEYVLIDSLLNEEHGYAIGHHSGISDDEVYVPLVVID